MGILARVPPWEMEETLLKYIDKRHEEEKRRGEPLSPEEAEELQEELYSELVEIWTKRLSPRPGHAASAAVRPFFEDRLESRYGVVTDRKQVFTGHGWYLFRIGW